MTEAVFAGLVEDMGEARRDKGNAFDNAARYRSMAESYTNPGDRALKGGDAAQLDASRDYYLDLHHEWNDKRRAASNDLHDIQERIMEYLTADEESVALAA